MKKIKNPYTGIKGYNCFACAPGNELGLHMEFVDEGEYLCSYWTPRDQFQGYKNLLHGGIQATLMDELAAWYISTKMGTGGVTARMETRYKKPVYTDKGPLKLRASLKESNNRIATILVELYNNNGELGSTGTIEYFILNPEKAKETLMYPGKEAFYEDE